MKHLYRFRCQNCGVLTASRRPIDDWRNGDGTGLRGDGTIMFPRRHRSAEGAPCPGNALHAAEVVMDPGTFAVIDETAPDFGATSSI